MAMESISTESGDTFLGEHESALQIAIAKQLKAKRNKATSSQSSPTETLSAKRTDASVKYRKKGTKSKPRRTSSNYSTVSEVSPKKKKMRGNRVRKPRQMSLLQEHSTENQSSSDHSKRVSSEELTDKQNGMYPSSTIVTSHTPEAPKSSLSGAASPITAELFDKPTTQPSHSHSTEHMVHSNEEKKKKTRKPKKTKVSEDESDSPHDLPKPAKKKKTKKKVKLADEEDNDVFSFSIHAKNFRNKKKKTGKKSKQPMDILSGKRALTDPEEKTLQFTHTLLETKEQAEARKRRLEKVKNVLVHFSILLFFGLFVTIIVLAVLERQALERSKLANMTTLADMTKHNNGTVPGNEHHAALLAI